MSRRNAAPLLARVTKLSLAPGDLLIVRDPADLQTFIDLTNQGIGFTPYANPVLLIPGGLEKASREALLEALSVVDQVAADRLRQAAVTEPSRIITDLSTSVLKRVQ